MSIFPTKVLLATDGSKEADLAGRSAAELADKTGSKLHVVHVLALPIDTQDPFSFQPEVRRQLEKHTRERLEEVVGTIEARGGEVAGSHLRVGRPDAEIIAQAEQIGVGLIVMGSRGRGGIRRALMGSVSDSVVRHAYCPVMVVRGEATEFPDKILLATDGSEEARLAATTAADVAERTGSELHVVHVGEVRPVYHPAWHGYVARYEELQEEAQRLLEEQVEHVKAAGAKVAETHLGMGRPDEEIVVLGQEIGAGLIVTGSRGLGGIRRALMGSVSDSVVRHAHCPLLVVRQGPTHESLVRPSRQRG
jgi:nucleotide-binding universal stress UspA family protein